MDSKRDDDYKIVVQRKDGDRWTTIHVSEIRQAEDSDEAVARFVSAFSERPDKGRE